MIPIEVRDKILSDPFYLKCCITGKTPVQWHHNLIYGHNKVEEAWCILPLYKEIHDIEKRKDIKEKLDWIMLNRGTDEELLRYSKVINLIKRRDILNEKFGFPVKEC